MRVLGLLCFATIGARAATELTEANFDSVREGKHAFVKFLAPWWGHCKKMKPDWDALAEEFKDSSSVVIADVDCTAAGKSLCDKNDVRGYPTIKTFAAGDDDGESYEGDRSLDALRKHAESLGPQCGVDRKDLCSAEQLTQLEKYVAMSQARRDAKMIKLKNAIKKLEASHEALQKRLSAEFEASKSSLEALQEKYKPQLKMLKAATPSS